MELVRESGEQLAALLVHTYCPRARAGWRKGWEAAWQTPGLLEPRVAFRTARSLSCLGCMMLLPFSAARPTCLGAESFPGSDRGRGVAGGCKGAEVERYTGLHMDICGQEFQGPRRTSHTYYHCNKILKVILAIKERGWDGMMA